MAIHRRAIAIVFFTLCAAGCAPISCRHEFIVNSWTPPAGVPDAESGPLTAKQRAAQIESISFLTCSYND